MKIKIDRDVRHSILVEETDLQSLSHFISSKYKHVRFTISCIDGSFIETENIRDIIDFENPNFRKIKSLSIEANDNLEERLSIDIRDEIFSSGANIRISSTNDAHAVYMINEITNRISEMKASYNLLTGLLGWVIYGAIISLVTVVILYSIDVSSRQGGLLFGFSDDQKNALVILSLIFFVPIAAFGKILMEKVFPKVFFLLGRQKKTMEAIRKWRSFVFGGLLLTIFTGILVNFISNVLLNQ